MERKQSGGCCLVPRYGGQQQQQQQAAAGMSWQMGRIMLKFRPIAPKPAAMAPAPTPAPVAAAGAAAGAGRGKRKAVGGGRRGRKPKKAATTVAPPVMTTAAPATTVAPPVMTTTAPAAPAPAVQLVVVAGDKESEKEKSLSSRSSSSSAMTSVDSAPPSPRPLATTLPLMPVSPAAAEEKAVLSAEETPRAAGAQPAAPRPTPPAAAPTTSCWVTVEDVTSTWRDGEAPSSAAVAAASACGADGVGDAPAFVSDQWGRVTWANAAFARAVSDGDGDSNTPVVGLAGALPAWGTCAGFTCRVRVRHAADARSVVAPCDVWRLDAAGCYLWRLDLQAALTLGGGLP